MADLDTLDAKAHQTHPQIDCTFESSPTLAQQFCRFELSLREDKDSTHAVYVDVPYINKKPLLHIFDEAINYQTARYLSAVSAVTLWQAL